jgi:outer membrane protein assembly factor BamE
MKPVVYLLAACAFSLGLSGCASKRNPLIDEPASSVPAPVTNATAASAKGEIKTSAGSATTASAAQSAANGVQTTAPLTTFQRFLYVFTPFRIDVQQGNFISQEQVAQLKEGMTRDQVRFVLGSPLLADVFHGNRWDYAFRVQKGSGETTSSKVTVLFKDDRLQSFTGSDLPTEQDYIARLAGPIVGSKKEDTKADAKAPEAAPATTPAAPPAATPAPVATPVAAPAVTPVATPVTK